MDLEHSQETFVPRAGFVEAGASVLDFFNRRLTLLSVLVSLLACLVMVVGPLRVLVGSQVGAATTGFNPLDIGQGPGALSAEGGPLLSGDALDRQLIPFTIIPDRPRGDVSTYTVQPGDTLIAIAERFGLDANTIFWSNGDALRGDVHMLRPGVNLFVLPVDGAYHKADGEQSIQAIADQYGVPVEAVLDSEFNPVLQEASPIDVLPFGVRLVIPGGQGETANWQMPVIVEEDNPTTGGRSTSFMPGMGGSCRSGITGSGGTGAWAVPVSGAYRVTQGFGSFHSGLDLAANVGTSVVASDTGVVVFSGWVDESWGYGILVVLDHGNGWTTYYAHLSSNGVGCGQLIQRGAYLGAVGSTGNSSGAHLHFEMRWNHVPDNPAAYIGF